MWMAPNVPNVPRLMLHACSRKGSKRMFTGAVAMEPWKTFSATNETRSAWPCSRLRADTSIVRKQRYADYRVYRIPLLTEWEGSPYATYKSLQTSIDGDFRHGSQERSQS